MAAQGAGLEPVYADDDEVSLLALGSVLLRSRRAIIVLGMLGMVMGLSTGLLSKRVYVSSATFISQGSESGNSGLVMAASQLGIRVPTGSSAWGPGMYVELLHSRALLEPIAFDTMVVAEEGGRRAMLMDLLGVTAPTSARRLDGAVQALGNIVRATEDKKLNAVTLTASTPWPSVSQELAKRLVQRVNQFNMDTRKSQAAAERHFVDGQAAESERALRDAEDRLQSFLQRNRVIGGSPELTFQHERLQRDVALRQQIYSSWLQSREEARIREVRDTPVITVLEEPRLPSVGASRGTLQKGVLGAAVGAMIGVVIAFLIHGLTRARHTSSEESREFFRLMEEATPRFLRKPRRTATPSGPGNV